MLSIDIVVMFLHVVQDRITLSLETIAIEILQDLLEAASDRRCADACVVYYFTCFFIALFVNVMNQFPI
jgi:hypothetical protein